MIAETPSAVERIATVSAPSFLDLVLAASGPIVVEFMSYGCAHCRVLEPVLQEVAATLAAEESFFRVNVALDAGLANSYDIRGTPTLLLFRNGMEIERLEGPSPSAASLLSAVTQPFSA
jgi:thioredoxin 1